ncbi:MAG: DUF429 domain-containing protein [Tepidisphaeraceae bacterium]
MPEKLPQIRTVFGVDFSGAALAGRNAWVAQCEVDGERLNLIDLSPLEKLAGTAERAPALAHLVSLIRASHESLWGMDFPFGLPIELGWKDWPDQLRFVSEWKTPASGFGNECVARCKAATGSLHVKRQTDVETRTPFDCHHYRIIHQTFHGMRDVLVPLSTDDRTCVLPYQVDGLALAERVVVEACPSSTLKRMKLPHTRYKQPQGELEDKHRATRKAILAGLRSLIDLTPAHVRTMNANGGGDAYDAVIAAIGSWHAWQGLDVDLLKSHKRYRREGYVFA